MKTTECKFCGEGGLTWVLLGGSWRLMNEKGQLHECEEAKLHFRRNKIEHEKIRRAAIQQFLEDERVKQDD